MALQLSLFIQVPVSLGGLSGSACYITISSKLPTGRILQIVDAHPQLSPELCGLENINTIKSPNIPILIHILSKILPDLITAKANDPDSKPVRLVVIDALAELFRSDDKTTTSTLVDRSQNIVEISTLLHSLASTYNLAILVLNEVSDVFGHGEQETGPGDLSYKQQSRWFGSADSVPGEGSKEAALGLVWANQINVRIMFSRTGRRRYLEDSLVHSKRRKTDGAHPIPDTEPDDGATLIRRMSVVFSSVALPCSVDYIVTAAGISVLADDEAPLPPEDSFFPSTQEEARDDAPASIASQVAPLDMGLVEHDAQSQTLDTAPPEDEEWENYWNTDDIPEEMYNSME
jgi:DNA repair protein RAD57